MNARARGVAGWLACVVLGVAAAAGAVACVDPGGGASLEGTLDPAIDTEQVEVQPSCMPNGGGETDGHDDGHSCGGSEGPDVFCNAVPHPYLYCVSCNDGTSGCYEVPES